VLHYFPIFHIGGIMTPYHAAIRGCGMVLFQDFDAGTILKAVNEHQVPHLMGVPTIWQDLIAHPEIAKVDFSSVRYAHYGAAPMNDGLRARIIDIVGCEFVQYYGMTESVMVTALAPDDHRDNNPRMQSVGRVLPGVKLRILDESGRDRPAGAVGEIALQSEVMMSGYWKMDEATRQAFGGDGWYRTGDGGWLDPEGYLFLGDRIRDMIISGGENIYSIEVENVLLDHPYVAEVAVVGIPDDRWGEVPKAFVVMKPGCPFEPENLTAHAAQHLAKFKLPRAYEERLSLPRTPLGKVRKFELREQQAPKI
jgi:acyl-CoA synthetase (AMP-forming)/AMP-acid ligase II